MTAPRDKAREIVKAYPGHATFMGVLSNEDRALEDAITAALIEARESALEECEAALEHLHLDAVEALRALKGKP